MEKRLLYRLIFVGAVLLVCGISLIPTLAYDYRNNQTRLPDWWTQGALASVLPQNHLVLGLDLQGGMDLVVSVDVHQAVLNELREDAEDIREQFMKEKIPFKKVELDPVGRRLVMEFPNADAARRGGEQIRRYWPNLVIVEGRDTPKPVYALREAEEKKILKRTIQQVKEILARRVDAFGLVDPEIAIQGHDAIRLQLPGVKDPARVKKMIKRTARLEFMIVDAVGKEKEAAELAAGGPPPGMVLLAWSDPLNPENKVECYFDPASGLKEGPAPAGKRLVLAAKKPGKQDVDACYLLDENQRIGGEDLKDARPGYSAEKFGQSVVNFEWNMAGARKFAKLTGDNIGRQLAIVLEGRVESAPVIQAKIFNRGQIEGAFTAQEAQDLANVLRSGALEVNIKIEEERTVGATLGADSIHKGKVAIFWGFLAVVLFMAVYYLGAGLIADLALLLNLVIILAVLSLFGATLTLPGIAGIVLTVGMAVDANVLIFERIREELRTGKTPQAAIDAGYANSLWTILDANITTLIAALVLLQWGTGPIKGFAITLAVGIVSSMFTAIIVTRLVYDLIFYFRKRPSISLGIKLEPAPAAEAPRRRGRRNRES